MQLLRFAPRFQGLASRNYCRSDEKIRRDLYFRSSNLDSDSNMHTIIFNSLNMNKPSVDKSRTKIEPGQLYKLLDHPTRIAILKILRDGEHCVCHMEAYLGLRQAYISQQLSVLRDGGLIMDRRDGWNIFYRVSDPGIYDVLDAVTSFTGDDMEPQNKPDVVCTCPNCSKAANES